MSAIQITTAQELVTFALRGAGVLGVGQTALADDYEDAFRALNGMIGIWNRKRWLIWHLLDVTKVSTGAESYTVGPGQDFDTPRPDRLEAAFFRQLVNSSPNAIDYPLTLIPSREDYNDIALKNLQSWPQWIFYDSAYPVGVVYPWPVPQLGLYELHLTVKDVLTSFTSWTQQINLPPEYIEALWTNLTLRLGPLYQFTVSQDIKDLAKASLATIRGANTQISTLRVPAGITRPWLYNIYSDSLY